jgi:hypothetical protein
LVPLLESVYRGPPPASQVDALMAEFDSNKDGRISWEEFKAGVKRIKGACARVGLRGVVGNVGGPCVHDVGAIAAWGIPSHCPPHPWPCVCLYALFGPPERLESSEPPRAVTHVSGEQLREARHRHVRDERGPVDRFAVPLSTSHEVGWAAKTAVPLATTGKTFPRVACEVGWVGMLSP